MYQIEGQIRGRQAKKTKENSRKSNVETIVVLLRTALITYFYVR